MVETRDEGMVTDGGLVLPVQCIRREDARTPGEIRPYYHYHAYMEVLYGVGGELTVFVNGRVMELLEGDLLILHAGESHACYARSETAAYWVVKFFPEVLYTGEQSALEIRVLLPFVMEESAHCHRLRRADFARGILVDLMREWEGREYGYELAVRADILRLFLGVLRYWKQTGEELPRLPPDGLARGLQPAVAYTEADCAAATARGAAAACHFSYSYFSRSFKKVMGRSYTDYLRFVRLRRAERLLLTTGRSVSDIAQEVGFATASHFIEQFKRKKGVSPRRFRQAVLLCGSGPERQEFRKSP